MLSPPTWSKWPPSTATPPKTLAPSLPPSTRLESALQQLGVYKKQGLEATENAALERGIMQSGIYAKGVAMCCQMWPPRRWG